MRLGLTIGYSGSQLSLDMDLIREAEKLGYDSIWSAEAWGSDAVSPLAWIGAQTSRIKLGTGIMQIPARTPASTAMTAMTMDALSGGRFVLGLGTSGPQVVEGWHGQPFEKPLTWMREYITIIRKILERKEPLEFDGQKYQIPYRGPGATGLGKPLKSILHGRTQIPIYTGAMAPLGQQLAGELADGVLLTCMNPERPEVIVDQIKAGMAKSATPRRIEDFDVAPTVAVVISDDLDAARFPLKIQLALYIGGMGARDKNFYNEYLRRAGFEEEAIRIQDLYLSGRRSEAIAAVTDELVDTLYLVGPRERIRDRFQVWKEAGVGTFIVGSPDIEVIRFMAELAL
jgi:F420-dependent oxidoreductase-like protein